MSTIDLQPHEQVLAVIRRSVLRELPRMFFAVIWILVPFFFFFPLMRLGGFGFALFAIILGFALLYASRVWVSWFYSVFIITDERMIDAEQQGLFKREISEVPIIHMDEARVSKEGVVQKLFGLSTVFIHTHEQHEFDLKISDVRKADRVLSLLEAVEDIHAKASLGGVAKVHIKQKDHEKTKTKK